MNEDRLFKLGSGATRLTVPVYRVSTYGGTSTRRAELASDSKALDPPVEEAAGVGDRTYKLSSGRIPIPRTIWQDRNVLSSRFAMSEARMSVSCIALLGILGAGLVAVSGLLVWRKLLQRRLLALTPIDPDQGVQDLHHVEIGGITQAISVRGHDRDAPLLLYLHGGPGEPFLASVRVYLPELEHVYTVAYWAQRGTAGSFRRPFPSETMTVEQMFADTHAVVEWLCEHYGREKLVLMAGSWGTVLGAVTAARYPERFLAYIARSQCVDLGEADAFAARWALERATENGDDAVVRRIQRVAASGQPTALQGFRIAADIARYGGYAEKGARANGPNLPVSILGQLWGCPELSLADLLHALTNPLFAAIRLWGPTQGFKVDELAPRIEVPVYLLQGRDDIVAPTFLVERYFEALEAPAGKRLVIFENSQHLAHLTEREAYLSWLLERIPNELGLEPVNGSP